MFPQTHEVDEFERMITYDLLQKIVHDIRDHSHNGHGCTVEDLIGGSVTPERLDAYQRKLGPSNLPVYGGDTTCISVETGDGNILVFDCGSGIRNCSKFFVQDWPASKPREIFVFGTHEHLDHRSGLPFSQFLFVKPPFLTHIYGSSRFLQALDERYGIFSRTIGSSTHLDDPIDFRVMSASFKGYELARPAEDPPPAAGRPPPWAVLPANEPVRIGATTISSFAVYHGPAHCLAFKIQYGPVKFLFCTDHETRHGRDASDPRQGLSEAADKRLSEESIDVDAAYFDGQYFRQEYDGNKGIGVTQAVSRLDWGHGCIEDVLERVKRCHIKHAYIGHHDPERTWVARLELDHWLADQSRGQPYTVELAKSEGVLDL
ncbi:MAG: hypothetical protein ABSH22_08995 [Tepidisphaeraceae bacterium]|jgi:hypothetical protein